jgi:hypothetical protein
MKGASILVLLGCGCGLELEHMHRRGSVCLFPDGHHPITESRLTPQEFLRGKPVIVEFHSAPNEELGCPTEVFVHCAVLIEPLTQALVVDAYLAWDALPPGSLCSREYKGVSAYCNSPELDGSAITVTHASQRITLPLPSNTSEAPCLREPAAP